MFVHREIVTIQLSYIIIFCNIFSKFLQTVLNYTHFTKNVIYSTLLLLPLPSAKIAKYFSLKSQIELCIRNLNSRQKENELWN